eukprot:Ihof_evm7s143 gene=Ihof_evmTU7s143
MKLRCAPDDSKSTFLPVSEPSESLKSTIPEHVSDSDRSDGRNLSVDGTFNGGIKNERRANSPLFMKKVAVDPNLPDLYTHHGFVDSGVQPPNIKKLIIDLEYDGTRTHLDTHLPLVQFLQPAIPPIIPHVPDAEHPEEPIPIREFKVRQNAKLPLAPPRVDGFIRFIPKSQEDIDNEVEYDMDEEDIVWKSMINTQMAKKGQPGLTEIAMEKLINRIEKESFFMTQAKGPLSQSKGDDEAVCCICNDGDTEPGNAILFCDSCNIPVHQDCYGVPYIPEGLWLCRRCQFAPTGVVTCILCLSRSGAFKQTENGRWVHAVCAYWIPEVTFANDTILEPVVGIERVPKARWKLTCFICSKRGACIQCSVKHCCVAYHPSCALKANLFMKMSEEDVKTGETNNISYCDVHTPVGWGPITLTAGKDTEPEKVPIVSIPVIPLARLHKLAAVAHLHLPTEVLERLHTYWLLKRHSRSGVPLIRRLQNLYARPPAEVDEDATKLKNKVQRLRMYLERLRLVAELVVKREKAKRDKVRTRMMIFNKQVFPLEPTLLQVLQKLRRIDHRQIFHVPVNVQWVKDYRDIIKSPMDFETMGKKVETHQYCNIDQFQEDFQLILRNCMRYNGPDTLFYKEALNMQRKGGIIFEQVRESIKDYGIDPSNGLLRPLVSRPASPVANDGPEVIITPPQGTDPLTNSLAAGGNLNKENEVKISTKGITELPHMPPQGPQSSPVKASSPRLLRGHTTRHSAGEGPERPGKIACEIATKK